MLGVHTESGKIYEITVNNGQVTLRESHGTEYQPTSHEACMEYFKGMRDQGCRGWYKHYKGAMYHVWAWGLSESDGSQKMVLYSDKNGNLWIRPFDMFFEKIPQGSEWVPRFAKVEFLNN